MGNSNQQVVTVNYYSDGPSGHVAIKLQSGTYEQSWTPDLNETTQNFIDAGLPADAAFYAGVGSTIGNLFTTDGDGEDGTVRVQVPARREVVRSVSFPVTGGQMTSMENYVQDRLEADKVNDYSLTRRNCILFVEDVLDAGVVIVDW